VAHNFIQSFLNNCSSKKLESDYRPILQNLVEDLLVTLNLPEWPASEILLSIICRNLARIVLSEEANESLKQLRCGLFSFFLFFLSCSFFFFLFFFSFLFSFFFFS
jgi:hypothetical protein